MKNDKEESATLKPAETFNLLLVLLGAYRLCMLPFLRRGFGPHAFGFPGLIAAVFILLTASFGRAPALMNFFYVWLAVVILHRMQTGLKLRRGWVVHSRYQGTPWLAMKFVKNEKRARGFEALMCMGAGVALMPLSPSVGAFVMFGGFALIFYMGIENALVRARVRRMVDSQIEQRFIAEQYRGG